MRIYRFGPFTLDAQQLLLQHDGAALALGPKVVETLLALIEAPGEVHAKSALLDRIWPEGYVEEANLAQNIYVLRKALKAHWNIDAIETIPRRGYRFTAPVTVVDRQLAEPERAPLPIATPVVAANVAARPWSRYAAVAAAIVLTLSIATGLSVARRDAPAAASAQRLSANGSRLYAIGRYYWNLRTRDGVVKSLDYFTRVIDTDPRDPRGYAGLAQANATMADYEYGPLKPAVYLARAREYAKHALTLDPSSSDAYAALGSIDINENNYDRAQVELQRSIALDPQNGPAHEWLGTVFLQRGNVADAFAELKKSANLDPLNVSTTAWLGSAAYLTHHFDEAIAYAQQTIDLSPKRSDAYEVLGLAYEAQGDNARAIKSFETFKAGGPWCRAQGAALLAHLYARMGRTADARRELDYAIAHADHVMPEDMAVAFMALGERDRARPFIARARKSHAWTAIAQDPRVQAESLSAS